MSVVTKDHRFSRQNIRRWLLIISFILLPVTLFYISPIVILMGAAEGIVTGSMILFILLFILSLAVSRLWCGWFCPMGGFQELCSPVMKHTVQEGWRNRIKYGVTILWLALLAFLFINAGGIHAVDPFYSTENGLSITSVGTLTVVIVIFAIFFLVAFFSGRRGFCHVLCPIAALMIAGRKIRNLVGFPAFQLGANKDLCIDCRKCTNECPMGLDVNGMVRGERMENPDCILCVSCVDICPKDAISCGWVRNNV